jgi:hypothetical protein
MRDLPSDFDWVAERTKCSAAKMFELLKLGAIRNIETINASGQVKAQIVEPYSGTFSVIRFSARGDGHPSVRFTLVEDEIDVAGQGVEVGFTARLTLNDDGECRFLVAGVELALWQVLRRALEPLFFRREF